MKTYCIIAIYSSQQVSFFENILKQIGIITYRMPTPRGITQGCSYSLRFEEMYLEVVKQECKKYNLASAGTFKVAWYGDKFRVIGRV